MTALHVLMDAYFKELYRTNRAPSKYDAWRYPTWSWYENEYKEGRTRWPSGHYND